MFDLQAQAKQLLQELLAGDPEAEAAAAAASSRLAKCSTFFWHFESRVAEEKILDIDALKLKTLPWIIVLYSQKSIWRQQ